MPEPSVLRAWETFYVIVGSSAGALTGLQFVVMTLIAQGRPSGARGETISAFGSPNVVHFCSALLVASILTVPWNSLRIAGLAAAGCGAAGILYSVVVLKRALRQREYRPVFEDWLWHSILPTLAYAALLVSGLTLEPHLTDALLGIAAGTLLLVFVGIHNAWDTVTYLMMGFAAGQQEPDRDSGEKASTNAGESAVAREPGAPRSDGPP